MLTQSSYMQGIVVLIDVALWLPTVAHMTQYLGHSPPATNAAETHLFLGP